MAENRQALDGCEHMPNILRCPICNRPIGLVDLKRAVTDIKEFKDEYRRLIAKIALKTKSK